MTFSLKTGLAALVAAATFATGAAAQGWTPPGPITLKISFAPGAAG